MNRLPLAKRAQLVGLLVEGNSIRASSRLAGVSFNSVLKFVADIGAACSDYQDRTLRNLPCQRLQLDEIWTFTRMKEKNVPEDKRGITGYGDTWTWCAICADTKLVPSWIIGNRSGVTARYFVDDLASRLANRVQITTDGHRAYVKAIEASFGGSVDYAMLDKIYATPSKEGQKRYSPAECVGTKVREISGNPDPKHISTSFAERQNLTMRMNMRRFTRLTNGFSKKAENHGFAVALHYMWYNFGRIHKTLGMTPAMKAGVADHAWTWEEIAALDAQVAPAKRGPYKKQNVQISK